MELEGLIMHQFFQLTRIISRSLNKRFSSYNLHFSEWGIVLILREKGVMTQCEMANYLHVEPSAISRSLVGLEKKGYIKREAGVDRREKQVSLTDLAEEQYPVWESIAQKYRQSILIHLPENKKEELYKTLNTICQVAQQMEDH